MSLKSPSGRLARWALQLQPYNLRIEYTPGKANVVADTLSRPFLTEEPPLCHISLIHTELPRRGAAETRQGQFNDPDLKKIIDAYEHGTREETERWTARGYLLTHGVLFDIPQTTITKKLSWLSPNKKETIFFVNSTTCRQQDTTGPTTSSPKLVDTSIGQE
jgi:hypothetical protein